MTELKPIKDLFAVEVPKESYYHEIAGNRNTGYWNLWYRMPSAECYQWDVIPLQEKFTVLFPTAKATEEQAAEVVQFVVSDMVRGYRDYEAINEKEVTEAIQVDIFASLKSLLRANGLDAEKNYLLLIKNQ